MNAPANSKAGDTGLPKFTRALVTFFVGAVTQYVGYALAFQHFSTLPALWSSWLRTLFAGLILTLLLRPWRAVRPAGWYAKAAGFGLVVLTMNMGSFVATSHLQLGVVTALEFVGPIGLAVVLSRTFRSAAVAGLTAVGVVLILLPDLSWGDLDFETLGVTAAFVSALMWALYVVLGGWFPTTRESTEALAVGMLVSGLLAGPLVWGVAAATGTAITGGLFPALGVGLLVALLASVVPYCIDLWCIGLLGPRAFSLLVAQLPVVSTAIAVFLLGQHLHTQQYIGIALVAVSLVWVRLVSRPRPVVAPEVA